MPLDQFLVDHESPLRLGAFLGALLLLAALERLVPRRRRAFARLRRWPTNLAIAAIDTLALRLLLPILAVGAAFWAEMNQVGLMELLPWPAWLEIALAVLLLDALVYGQHVAFHHVPVLWRIHRVHHTDRDIDVTTALRFHPVEILLSMLLKIAFVVVLGAPVAAVICFEVILNAMAMFNHANLSLPPWLERRLRLLLVTPDMHRVHHSVDRAEHDRNFGFSLSCWDRIFATYQAQPRLGHDAMAIGLAQHQDERPCSLAWTLLLPFARRRRGEHWSG